MPVRRIHPNYGVYTVPFANGSGPLFKVTELQGGLEEYHRLCDGEQLVHPVILVPDGVDHSGLCRPGRRPSGVPPAPRKERKE
jgi:hypothetical protein